MTLRGCRLTVYTRQSGIGAKMDQDTERHLDALKEAKRRFPPMWVIYDRPRDHPTHFVVRCWYGMVPDIAYVVVNSLVEARKTAAIAGASVPLQRDFSDDPCIVEIWL